MKKIFTALFLLIIALSYSLVISTSSASITPTITIDPNTRQFPSAHVGDTIDVNITISDVENLWLWDIATIQFNPAMLNLTSVTEGPFLRQKGQTLFVSAYDQQQANNGLIPDTTDALMVKAGASGSGVLATLTFQVLSTGTSQIAFNQTNLEDANQISAQNPQTMNCITTGASIIVGNAQSTTTSTPISSPTVTTSSSSSPSATDPTANSNSPSTTNPTAMPSAPEFPTTFAILVALLLGVTLTVLIVAKRRKS